MKGFLFLLFSLAQASEIAITTTEVRTQDLAIWQYALGQLEALNAPTIAAEVGGRMIEIKADVGQKVLSGQVLARIDPFDYQLAKDMALADIERLNALIKSQTSQVKRLRTLIKVHSSNQSALDEAEAQLGALKAQISAARLKLKQAQKNLERSQIISPIDAQIDQRLISVGDYVKTGTPLFRLTTWNPLRVRLLFPESMAAQLYLGLPVRLSSPMAPDQIIQAQITDIRPVIRRDNRAIELIIDLNNPGGWEAGASITGAVRLAEHTQALVVPEISVVHRPVGSVVYVIQSGIARQKKVKTGWHIHGWVEILSGLKQGDRIAVDGAGFLTDGASVEVKE